MERNLLLTQPHTNNFHRVASCSSRLIRTPYITPLRRRLSGRHSCAHDLIYVMASP
jgi:hypothetical protein